MPSTKKVTKTEYECECEDFCVPGPSLRTVCHDECGKKKDHLHADLRRGAHSQEAGQKRDVQNRAHDEMGGGESLSQVREPKDIGAGV